MGSVLFALQVRHQSAVTSTKTTSPADTRFAISERSNAIQAIANCGVERAGADCCKRGPAAMARTRLAMAIDHLNWDCTFGRDSIRTARPDNAATAMTDASPATPSSTQNSHTAVASNKTK